MRLFVAVELVDDVRSAIERALAPQRAVPELPRGLRWLPAESWHVTLQFLGNVQERVLPDLEAACVAAARSRAPFELVLQGAGAFTPRAARVLWLGVTAGTAPLGDLANALATRTEALGFAREERAFSAHVTLARLKPPGDLRPALARLQLGPFAQRVTHLTLMRSHISQQGAKYEALLRAALAQDAAHAD